jgi:hypothetical protein
MSCLLMRSWSDGEAAIIRQLLATYGIPCQVVSDISHTVLPFSLDGLGEIRIFVAPSSLREAQSLLAEHRRQGLRVIRGGRAGEAGEEDDGRDTGAGGLGSG